MPLRTVGPKYDLRNHASDYCLRSISPLDIGLRQLYYCPEQKYRHWSEALRDISVELIIQSTRYILGVVVGAHAVSFPDSKYFLVERAYLPLTGIWLV
jgi:hypothetical protein